MATVASILGDIATLPTSDKEKLRAQLVSVFTKHSGTLDKFVFDERFSAGIVCPYCGKRHISRNGHRKDGAQRYICMDCGRTFVATTNTITAGTKKDLRTWEKYIDCLMNGFSLRKSADICKMHRNTAFAWRHKILEALQIMAKAVTLDGIIEADETFFTKSYKGNHKKGSFNIPRISHKRGNSTHTKGLSREKICVPCAVNRNGLSIATASNLGRVATKNLHKVYDGRISKDSVLVTDLMNSYKRFATKNGIDLIQLKGGKSKKGIYNIQHINSYHSELKRFMERFKGVSSKHLNNYLIWHNFVNYAPESETEKRAILLKFALTQNLTVHAKDISRKPALPFIA